AQIGGAVPVSDADLESRRIQHPNVVPMISVGSAGDTFFWISPDVDARTLSARLSRGGRIEMRDSLTVLRDVSAGLTHAHLHGVVHGGLSPDSILISGGSALVADLGIAEVFTALKRASSSARATPASSGALRYMSPEQASGKKADTRSDAYSWGVIAYELLAGRHPFAGRSTPQQIIAAHTEETPPPITNLSPDLPQGITRLIMRCLSKDPSKRPETARDIRDVMTKEMLQPDPSPPAGSGQKAVIALMILAVVAIGVIAWLGMR
ncbi:MAG TPA: serine/threonine-protein kinase, partial [Gemmatimonadaceae bacterium]|nr:serine/threonine-protein kinase [Gemmatimonadaceae bacterium]